jgi:hypothetical protein
MNDSEKLDQILKMLADLDSRVTRLEESKGNGKSDSGEEDDDESDDESSESGEQDSDSADSADDGSDSDSESDSESDSGNPSDESQEPPEDWDTPDPVENEFPEEPRKGKPQGGNASDEQEDDGNTCDALNCSICAGTSMRASVPWSDSGEPL